jgi:hypothetical protein
MPGDVLHSPLQAHYPELSSRFDVDKNASAKTRRSFLERYCDTRALTGGACDLTGKRPI